MATTITPDQVKKWKKLVREARSRIKATILWGYGGGGWIEHFVLCTLPCNILEQENIAQYSLQCWEQGKIQNLNIEIDIQSALGNITLKDGTLESMVASGLCELQMIRGYKEFRIVKGNRAPTERVKKMTAAWQVGMARANEWLESGLPVLREQVCNQVSWLIGTQTKGEDVCTVLKVVMQVFDQKTSEAAKATPARPVVMPTMPAANDAFFWSMTTFFEESTMRHFDQAQANVPTRMIAKAVIVQVLRRAEIVKQECLPGARQLRDDLAPWLGNVMFASLCSRLYLWCLNNGLPEVLRAGGCTDRQRWWPWLTSQVNWAWIADKLQEEFTKYGHRRENRALELATSMFYEHIEWKLGDFAGSFEEKFLVLRG